MNRLPRCPRCDAPMSSYFQLGASGRWSCRDCGSDWCVEELEQAEADDMARAEAATAPDEVKSEQ